MRPAAGPRSLPAAPGAMPAAMNQRRLLVVATVILLHGLALWALQAGLAQRAAEVLVPGEILSEILAEPAPAPPGQPQPPRAKEVKPPPASPSPPPEPEPARAPVPQAAAPLPALPPAPAPTPAVAPATQALEATAPNSNNVAAAPAPAPRIELPNSSAAYLNNPKPPYPALSRQLGEEGRVEVRVFIGVDGLAQKAEIQRSSGYERLDRVAQNAALRWRYVPGKRNGVAEAMWVVVPINFVLSNGSP